MNIIRSSSENEMVYEFLKMELYSERFANEIRSIIFDLKIDENIITKGSIICEEENLLRYELLKRFRGYRNNQKIFENFPINIDWKWTIFSRNDIGKVRYINYSYWNELSNYTGSPIEAVKSILSGKVVFGVPNDGFIEASKALKNGVTFPPLIMLTDETESKYIILEGHKRMTAYGFVPELFENISVLLGFCNNKELMLWYGDFPSEN